MEIPGIDVLNIPTVCAPFTGLVWGIAVAIIPLIFILSILTEKAKLIKGENPEFHSVIWIAVLVIFSIQIYRLIFMKIIALCETIAFSVFSLEIWGKFMMTIEETQVLHGGISLIQLDFTKLFANITLSIAVFIEKVFDVVRFTFLSCLYVVGPITFAFAIYQPTRSLFKGWLMSVFQVSFWIVTLRVFQGVLVSLQMHQMVVSSNIVGAIIVSLAVIIITALAPAFTSKLFSGQNVGLLGSAIIAFSTLVLTKAYQKVGSPILKHVMHLPATATKTALRTASVVSGVSARVAQKISNGVNQMINKYREAKKR